MAMTEDHPEAHCQACGGPNPCWASPDWNDLVGSPNGILCPVCFMLRAPDAVWDVTRRDLS